MQNERLRARSQLNRDISSHSHCPTHCTNRGIRSCVACASCVLAATFPLFLRHPSSLIRFIRLPLYSSHSPNETGKVTFERADAFAPETYAEHLKGASAVIVAVGGPPIPNFLYKGGKAVRAWYFLCFLFCFATPLACMFPSLAPFLMYDQQWQWLSLNTVISILFTGSYRHEWHIVRPSNRWCESGWGSACGACQRSDACVVSGCLFSTPSPTRVVLCCFRFTNKLTTLNARFVAIQALCCIVRLLCGQAHGRVGCTAVRDRDNDFSVPQACGRVWHALRWGGTSARAALDGLPASSLRDAAPASGVCCGVSPYKDAVRR